MTHFPVHWGLGIAPNVEQSVVKVLLANSALRRSSPGGKPVSSERIARGAKGRKRTLRLSQIAVDAGQLGPDHHLYQSETYHTG